MMKKWIYWPTDCPVCGNDAKVYTDHFEDGYAFEGDPAKCVECDNTGIISVDDGAGPDGDGVANIQWNKWN